MTNNSETPKGQWPRNCAFCNTPPDTYVRENWDRTKPDRRFMVCENKECAAKGIHYQESAWQGRPIEDALEKALKLNKLELKWIKEKFDLACAALHFLRQPTSITIHDAMKRIDKFHKDAEKANKKYQEELKEFNRSSL